MGLFFLTGLRPVLRLRRSTPSARCAFGAPPSQLDRPCAPPGVLLTTGSTLRLGLSTYSFAQLIWMIEPLFQSGKGFLTHFLMKHLDEVGTRKKRPASRVFFFLPAFGRCCPPRSVGAQQALATKVNIARLQSNSTFSFKHHLTTVYVAIADHSFKHHLTGEAWPACRAFLPFHSNTT